MLSHSRQDCTSLRERALNFLSANLHEVKRTAQWREATPPAEQTRILHSVKTHETAVLSELGLHQLQHDAQVSTQGLKL